MIYQYDNPECLGEDYVGAWLEHDSFSHELADATMAEVITSGQLEDIWDESKTGKVKQVFYRLPVDLTREHDFPRVAEVGEVVRQLAVSKAAKLFPVVESLTMDEAVAQIYPAGEELPLGWHKDHENDKILVASVSFDGSGEVGFTHVPPPIQEINDEDVVCRVETNPLDTLFFRANGLYVPDDGSDIRMRHAVTKIFGVIDRFTIQYRMSVNAQDYGNVHVNKDAPLLVKAA